MQRWRWWWGPGFNNSKAVEFSRDAEREADRIGFQILKTAVSILRVCMHFRTYAACFAQLYSDNGLSYLRSHP